ncbi:uncharacterized protein LOC141641412 [Silene latifolia]|uniref:uncharacterized protein LOC141641412 n=1 Tax=Silene latifolia TaxID=37657 RepID=UPI003D771DE1
MGSFFGFFKAKRGIRQGDPLSPLLFTICMEYLSRVLLVIQEREGFKFHPLCKPLKLSHLCFVDDLLMLCKREKRVVIMMLRAFETLSKASGLCMNKSKSCIYSNGVLRDIISKILHISGMGEGKLPFRYLGVPIDAKILSSLDCSILVDRVCERIRAIGTRKLSYAGRLVLTKSVLSTLHCYWARIFILPVSILDKVEAICRSFLWQGKEYVNSPPLIAWNICCKSKKNGGLGVIDLRRWNKAALGKYIWWISHKKDHLLVKWVHAIYIKNSDWMNYQPKADSSWSWRKICSVKDHLKAGYQGIWWLQAGNNYTIKQGYQWLGTSDCSQDWAKFVWNNLSVPKHYFIKCLVAHRRLLTMDRLHNMHLCSDKMCVLCGVADEDHSHLFFQCDFSRRCLQLVIQNLGIQIPVSDFVQWWLRAKVKSLLRKKILAAMIQGLVYKIWEMKNRCRIDHVIGRSEFIVRQLREEISSRVLRNCNAMNRDMVRQWLNM